jgi:hypothetical protein
MDSSGKVIRVDFKRPMHKVVLDKRPLALIEQPHPSSWEPAEFATLLVIEPHLFRPGIADLTHLSEYRIETQEGKRIHHLTFDNGQNVRLEISETGFAIWGAIVNLIGSNIKLPTRPEA